ncbi:MAG: 2-hydroxychromene-2-carboxylate isomerase [Cryomorphaceae bacterium]|jgi:2-hydroxychromene-2-carboxylate isomerase
MQLKPLHSSQPVIVYLDFKSPYAYLAVEPTRRLERELGLRFDWRPFVLDIPSYLGSASLDKSGEVAMQDRTAEQWGAIKYAYYDCRRYASISNLTIRGTTKIWNTNLAATAMLWVREHAIDQLPLFIDLVYGPFWKRELDIENERVITAILKKCGLDGKGFEQWAAAQGNDLNSQLQNKAFKAGVYGVPTYVVNGELFFGREHLPRITWLLGTNTQAAPDIANLLPAAAILNMPTAPKVTVGIDDSVDSALAIPLLKSLFDELNVIPVWTKICSQKLDDLIPQTQAHSRGELHRQLRENTAQHNLHRYAENFVGIENLDSLINQTLIDFGVELSIIRDADLSQSPFPGIVVTINEERFIGRQHLPLIRALLS